MKNLKSKKVLAAIAAIVFAAIMTFNVNFSSSNNSLTNIALANVEALALNEGGTRDCADGYPNSNSVHVIYCKTCQPEYVNTNSVGRCNY